MFYIILEIFIAIIICIPLSIIEDISFEAKTAICYAIFVALIQVIVGTLSYLNQKKFNLEQDKKNERYKKEERQRIIDKEVRRFILKYNTDGQIYLLPLCAMAFIYKDTFYYNREIYRDFNMLDLDIKEELFRKYNLPTKLLHIKIDEDLLCDYISKIKNKLYSNKHFKNDFEICYNDHIFDHFNILDDKDIRKMNISNIKLLNNRDIIKSVTFGPDEFIDYEDLISDFIARPDLYPKYKPLIRKIFNTYTNEGIPNKDDIIYIFSNLILKYAMIYIFETELDENFYYNDFTHDNGTGEDLFLETILYMIYTFNNNFKD